MPITRRELLAGSAALAVGFPTLARAAPRVELRLLETSDLHMFVLDWDYYHARPDPTVGLSKIASLVADARAQAQNALLFDNGDLLQGSPLGDYVARRGGLASGAHPVFRAMNHMRYDAATPGNHEFNFGLDFLERSLAGAAFPYIGANIERADGAAFLPPFRILTRRLTDDGGVSRELRIGVLGLAPPQIMIWDRVHLEGRLRCGDMVVAARRVCSHSARAMRYSGCALPFGDRRPRRGRRRERLSSDRRCSRRRRDHDGTCPSRLSRSRLRRRRGRRRRARDARRNPCGDAGLLGQPSRRHRSHASARRRALDRRPLSDGSAADLQARGFENHRACRR